MFTLNPLEYFVGKIDGDIQVFLYENLLFTSVLCICNLWISAAETNKEMDEIYPRELSLNIACLFTILLKQGFI